MRASLNRPAGHLRHQKSPITEQDYRKLFYAVFASPFKRAVSPLRTLRQTARLMRMSDVGLLALEDRALTRLRIGLCLATGAPFNGDAIELDVRNQPTQP